MKMRKFFLFGPAGRRWDSEKILQNLFYIDSIGAKIILRCPIIPGINFTENHFNGITILANKLNHVTGIQLEPYHPLGIDKAKKLGKNQKYQNNCFLSVDDILPFVNHLKVKTDVTVEIV